MELERGWCLPRRARQHGQSLARGLRCALPADKQLETLDGVWLTAIGSQNPPADGLNPRPKQQDQFHIEWSR